MTAQPIQEDRFYKIHAQPTAYAGGPEQGAPPPLKPGDRLTRDEFERRYEAMPHLKKAELIEGVVYMPSILRFDIHGEPHAHMITWLGVYCAATPAVRLGDNTTVRLDADNEPQPDALLRINEAHGGASFLGDHGYIEGAPELIVEIAGTSADYDLHEKLEVYRRNGVKEYIVWQTQDERLDWFRLVEGEYVPLTPDEKGVILSEVFPGLRLAVRALLEGNLAGVLSELQKGISTPEHAAFVARLSKT
ncbi:Uma2 family endonuclease [Candidatus Poribacteria bacterium]|nr:Uma2 family endonuclease [Candidatus Poribacteria bacterium]